MLLGALLRDHANRRWSALAEIVSSTVHRLTHRTSIATGTGKAGSLQAWRFRPARRSS